MAYDKTGKYIKGTKTKVAIACQGGGAQTAFTAGALGKILEFKDELKEKKQIEIVGLSGTSGGAICATLAWYGLLKDLATGNDGEPTAINWLKKFWEENSAKSHLAPENAFEFDSWLTWITDSYLLNQILFMGGTISHNLGVFVEFNPYEYPDYVRIGLKKLLKPYENFQHAQKWKDMIIKNNKGKTDIIIPYLLIGGANVKTGEFKVFHSDIMDIDENMLLASGAIPTVTKAVEIGNEKYWDGLYSQNPPVANFLGTHGIKDFKKNKKTEEEFSKKKPDEIWIIRINPKKCKHVPKTLLRIKDRQNELSGNLSLEQEIYFIKKLNEILPNLTDDKYQYVKMDHEGVPLEIAINEDKLEMELNLESKFNRDPLFISELIRHGEAQAEEFLTTVLKRKKE